MARKHYSKFEESRFAPEPPLDPEIPDRDPLDEESASDAMIVGAFEAAKPKKPKKKGKKRPSNKLASLRAKANEAPLEPGELRADLSFLQGASPVGDLPPEPTLPLSLEEQADRYGARYGTMRGLDDRDVNVERMLEGLPVRGGEMVNRLWTPGEQQEQNQQAMMALMGLTQGMMGGLGPSAISPMSAAARRGAMAFDSGAASVPEITQVGPTINVPPPIPLSGRQAPIPLPGNQLLQNQPVTGLPPLEPRMPSSTGPLSPFWSDPAMDMSMAGKITGGPLPSNEIAKGLASPAGMPRFGGHQPSLPPTPQSQSFPLIEEGVNLPPIRNPVLPQGNWQENFDPRWFSGEDFTHWPQGAPAPTQATIPTTPNAPALPALPEVLNYNTLPDASRLAEILGLPISKALALLGGAAGGAAGYSMAQGPGFESAPLQEPEPMINIDPATGRPIPNPSIPWHMLSR